MGAKKSAGGGSGRPAGPGGQLVLVGAVLFAVAWFVPVTPGQAMFGSWPGELGASGGRPPAVRGPDWLPGLQACEVAWQMLTGDASGDETWTQRLAGSTCLTNVAMLAGLVALAVRRHTARFGVLLLACAGLNACWLYLDRLPPADSWGVGYWLWLASFGLVGVGLLASRRA